MNSNARLENNVIDENNDKKNMEEENKINYEQNNELNNFENNLYNNNLNEQNKEIFYNDKYNYSVFQNELELDQNYE